MEVFGRNDCWAKSYLRFLVIYLQCFYKLFENYLWKVYFFSKLILCDYSYLNYMTEVCKSKYFTNRYCFAIIE